MMRGTSNAFRQALATWRRTLITGAVSIIVFLSFLLLTQPIYSFQLLSADIGYLPAAVSLLVWSQQATHGILGLLLPAVIALLAGVVTVTTGISLFMNYQMSGSFSGMAGGVIGVSAAGCASCGAGLLTLLGLSGGVALLPFNGIGVQVVSIGIMLGALEYTGRNRTCTIDTGNLEA